MLASMYTAICSNPPVLDINILHMKELRIDIESESLDLKMPQPRGEL